MSTYTKRWPRGPCTTGPWKSGGTRLLSPFTPTVKWKQTSWPFDRCVCAVSYSAPRPFWTAKSTPDGGACSTRRNVTSWSVCVVIDYGRLRRGFRLERADALAVRRCLDAVELRVLAAAGHQRLVGAGLDNASTVEDDDQICHS